MSSEEKKENCMDCQMLTKHQAIVITAVTGMGCVPPDVFIEDIEKRLGRKVYPQEFNNSKFRQEVQMLYYDHFFDMCYYPPHEGLILPGEGA